MKQDQFLHILLFLQFASNSNEIDKNYENYDRLWKIRDISEMLNNAYAKFYNPSDIWQWTKLSFSSKGELFLNNKNFQIM
jgi:hypothetical protein